jgi:hypothetical protein
MVLDLGSRSWFSLLHDLDALQPFKAHAILGKLHDNGLASHGIPDWMLIPYPGSISLDLVDPNARAHARIRIKPVPPLGAAANLPDLAVLRGKNVAYALLVLRERLDILTHALHLPDTQKYRWQDSGRRSLLNPGLHERPRRRLLDVLDSPGYGGTNMWALDRHLAPRLPDHSRFRINRPWRRQQLLPLLDATLQHRAATAERVLLTLSTNPGHACSGCKQNGRTEESPNFHHHIASISLLPIACCPREDSNATGA